MSSPDSGLFKDAEFGENYANYLRQLSATENRRFERYKRCQLLIPTHNEPPFIIAMCVSYANRSPAARQQDCYPGGVLSPGTRLLMIERGKKFRTLMVT